MGRRYSFMGRRYSFMGRRYSFMGRRYSFMEAGATVSWRPALQFHAPLAGEAGGGLICSSAACYGFFVDLPCSSGTLLK
jgi:hypothetical protein